MIMNLYRIMDLQTEAMISQRSLFPVAPLISPPIKVSKRSLFPVPPPIKAPLLLWAAPASIFPQLTPTLVITPATPPSPLSPTLCTHLLGPPTSPPSPAPAAPPGDVP